MKFFVETIEKLKDWVYTPKRMGLKLGGNRVYPHMGSTGVIRTQIKFKGKKVKIVLEGDESTIPPHIEFTAFSRKGGFLEEGKIGMTSVKRARKEVKFVLKERLG